MWSMDNFFKLDSDNRSMRYYIFISRGLRLTLQKMKKNLLHVTDM